MKHSVRLNFSLLLVLFTVFVCSNGFQCQPTIPMQKFVLLTSLYSNSKMIQTPATIADMMINVAVSINEARADNISIVLVDVPLPVTGGTEIDDWPGGINQKYATIVPMLQETFRKLNFSASAMSASNYLGDCGEEDAIGVWEDNGVCICVFPTVDTIPAITEKLDSQGTSIIALVNQQFFLDPLSKESSKKFLSSLQHSYLIENLLLRGPGAMPVRGLLFRQFPSQYKAGRRLDQGGYVLLKTYDTKPTRAELEELFFEDSKIRDKDLSFFERLRRQIPSV